MLSSTVRIPKRGDRTISAEFLRALYEEQKRQGNIEAAGALVESGAGGVHLTVPPRPPGFWAVITFAYGSGLYSWWEVKRTGLFTFEYVPEGRRDEGLDPAVEANFTEGIANGTFIWLERGWGEPVTGGVYQEWLFRHAAGGGGGGTPAFSGAKLYLRTSTTLLPTLLTDLIWTPATTFGAPSTYFVADESGFPPGSRWLRVPGPGRYEFGCIVRFSHAAGLAGYLAVSILRADGVTLAADTRRYNLDAHNFATGDIRVGFPATGANLGMQIKVQVNYHPPSAPAPTILSTGEWGTVFWLYRLDPDPP